ncbi:F-box/kelch-repeat protein [Senna tora]|uniref:F-box/kelch-repeat protein n=1 Tax=Senna tora TaxID=362788 RepID=A0A834W951_9FABA|nr:F-box/kelch-repeat protein [Senna tora]
MCYDFRRIIHSSHRQEQATTSSVKNLPEHHRQQHFLTSLPHASFLSTSLITMKNLPEHLLINILLRLPVKSLLRFKSVSKLWRSLISDPYFANSHYQRSSFLPRRLLHIADSQVRSIDFNSSFHDDSALVHPPFPITPPLPYLRVWGSSRGFVLLDDFNNFYMWNPSTASYKRLPYFSMPSQFSPFIYGFGYDASNDDYLALIAAYNPSDANYASNSQIFSFKSNSWKKLEGTNFPYINIVDEPLAGSFLNGAIHWLAYRHDTSVQLILGFDLTERKFMEIPLADEFDCILSFCFLATLGECLSLCVVDDTADIWLMKEYGVKSSWTKSVVVSLVDIPTDFFLPIASTQSGEIVGSDSFSELVKCNDKGEVLERRAYCYKGFEAVTYTETLFSIACDNVEASLLSENQFMEELALNCPYISLMDDPKDVNGANHWLAKKDYRNHRKLSLLRFKSVSKLWRSLISDPIFAISHFQCSSSFPDNKLLHIDGSKVQSIDLHSSLCDDSAVVELNFPIPPLPSKIWGSCRGFVLLDDYDLYVWNPSTGSCKVVPYFTMPSRSATFIYGFGYDELNDDYLVVLATHDPGYANSPSECQFFSIKANSWKQIDEDTYFPYMNAVGKPRAGSFLNGAIHWLAFRYDSSVELILAFNVSERNFIEIHLLEYFYEILDCCYLGTLGGCLSLCELDEDTTTNIWLMKEYGLKSSWTKSIVVSLDNIPTNYFCSIGLTQSGEIVGTDGESGLVKCNDKGDVLEYRECIDNDNDRYRSFETITYTETLLSLPGR